METHTNISELYGRLHLMCFDCLKKVYSVGASALEDIHLWFGGFVRNSSLYDSVKGVVNYVIDNDFIEDVNDISEIPELFTLRDTLLRFYVSCETSFYWKTTQYLMSDSDNEVPKDIVNTYYDKFAVADIILHIVPLLRLVLALTPADMQRYTGSLKNVNDSSLVLNTEELLSELKTILKLEADTQLKYDTILGVTLEPIFDEVA